MVLLLIALVGLIDIHARTGKGTSGTTAYPDFAYPATVSETAEADLAKGLKEKNYKTALEAVMNLTVARNMVSHSNARMQASLIDSLARISPSPYSNLFYLLEADLITDIYNSARWKYSNRNLPTDFFPENFDDWSKDLFALKVIELTQKACDFKAGFIDMPTSSLGKAVSIGSGLNLSPNVSQFLCYKANGLLQPFGSGVSEIIPFGYVGPAGKRSVTNRVHEQQLKIINSLLSLPCTVDDPMVRCQALVEKSGLLPESERKAFLEKCFDENKNSVFATLILERLFGQRNHDGDDMDLSSFEKEFYKTGKEFLRIHGNPDQTAGLRDIIESLESERIRFDLKSRYLSTDTVKTEVKSKNATDFYLLVYRLPDSRTRNFNVRKVISSGRIVGRIRLSMPGQIPYSAKDSVNLGCYPYGFYAVIPSKNSESSGVFPSVIRDNSVSTFRVSDLNVIKVNVSGSPKESGIYVTDGRNQKPLPGLQVRLTPMYGKEKKTTVLTTDKEGFVPIVERNCNLEIRRGADRLYSDYYGYYGGRPDKETKIYAQVLTDLSVYHPGDSVGFSIVTFTGKERTLAVAADRKVKAVLRDANYNQVWEKELSTDRSGRVSYAFRLPETGLLGRWSVNVVDCDSLKRNIGSGSFEVSDYKLPTFYAEIDSIASTGKAGDKVRIYGYAKTYSGMPVAGAEVKFDVRYVSWWLWRGQISPDATYAGTSKTGEDGRFEIELSTEGLKNTGYRTGVYRFSASVTSQAGETQEAPAKNFSLGARETIAPELPDQYEAEKGISQFKVEVKDIFGKPISKKVRYEVSGPDGKNMGTGEFMSPKFSIDLSGFDSGKYKFTFMLAQEDSVKVESCMILFRRSDRKPPVRTALWVPESRITVPAGNDGVRVRFGSSFDDSWILCQTASVDGLLDSRWIRVTDGITDIKVPAPGATKRIRVILTAMHDLEASQRTVEILPHASIEKFTVETLSFRDKVRSGDKESWKFRFLYAGDPAGFIPAMAVMSDKALNAISPFSWNFNPAGHIYYPNPVSTTWVANYTESGYFTLKTFKPHSQPVYVTADWNTYGNSLYPSYNQLRVRGTSFLAMDAAAPMVKNEMKAAKSLGATEESAKEDGAATGTAEGGENDDAAIRELSHPLAFFMPYLTTDGEGKLSLDFEVPNSNTTWQLQLLGYNKDMKTAKITLDAVSSKPVMISSNLPRFLRTGDRDAISFTLFNNTESHSDASVEVLAVDPLTGREVARFVKDGIRLDPKGSQTESMWLSVPDSMSLIEITAMIRSGNYADGERAQIAVLPSSSPVVESKPFYLGKDNRTFEMKLPKYEKGSRVTLQYCNNPLWYAVMSLPAYVNTTGKSLTTILDSYYANTVAGSIVDRNPGVREALSLLIKNSADGKDSVLMSNLQKNDELKIVSLNNTIWTGDASTETLRMLALSHLLDGARNKTVSAGLLKKITDLQNADGGWSWCPGMKSSYFMTTRALRIFSMLSQMGYLNPDKNLETAIKKGLTYCDSYWTNRKRIDPLDMLDYLSVKVWLPANRQSAAFSRLRKTAVEKVRGQWRKLGIGGKATASVLLWKEKYPMEAKSILESLRQLAVTDGNGTMKYDNLLSGYDGFNRLNVTSQVLNAFALIDPQCKSVDALRQALIYQKETEDWSANLKNVGVVQALLASGSDWTASCPMPEIRIDGKPIVPSHADSVTGYFKMSLPAADASAGKLTIEKTCGAPSWGSVMSQYIAPIESIKDYSIGDLSIRKKIYVVDEKTGETNLVRTPLKVGQKVRVMLELNAGKDMDYVAVTDERASFLEPSEQLSRFTSTDGLWYYKEVTDTQTNLFISFLPKGTHIVYYDCYVSQQGRFSVGIATAQSQYAPQITTHSAGQIVEVVR